MKSKIHLFITVVLLLTLNSACFDYQLDPLDTNSQEGYKPVYSKQEDLEKVEVLSPRRMETPGKIYIYGQYLFVNERFEGIHIINNINPSRPEKVSFIQIPGNVDMAVKGNSLYADNGIDMVVMDISNPKNVKLNKRIRNAFPVQEFPPFTGYFECVDHSKGIVTSWERTVLENPQCIH